MAKPDNVIKHILQWEGGYVNDPNDPGGATNRGVTLTTWQQYCHQYTGRADRANIEGLKAMTIEEWTDLFTRMFWDTAECSEIKTTSIADMLADFYWHSGRYAIRVLQRCAGATVDGIVGKNTLAMVNSFRTQRNLFFNYKQARIQYLENIVRRRPSSAKYLKGWLRRVNDLTYYE